MAAGQRPQRPRVPAIVGPTGVGKSAIALALAEELGAEIVSLDSRQVYRWLDIGTDKPTSNQRARVRHHLVDIVDPREPLALTDVLAMVTDAIEGILGRGRLPLLVGGTGQYVWAVVDGWRVPEVPPDPALREGLEAIAATEGPPALHARLAQVDPASAARIDPRNVRRVVRALEIHARTGSPVGTVQGRSDPPYDVRMIGLTRPRPDLYARIDRRIEAMLAGGLEDEVRGLVARGVGFDRPAMSGVGYREWCAFLDGAIPHDEVVRLIRHNTRRLVRMQMTWFRLDDARIAWVDLSIGGYDDVRDVVRRALAS
jgi:tRNA dimethylallyltransferase